MAHYDYIKVGWSADFADGQHEFTIVIDDQDDPLIPLLYARWDAQEQKKVAALKGDGDPMPTS